MEGREQLVPNSLLYLVARTFSQGATVSKIFTNPVKNFPPCRKSFTIFPACPQKIYWVDKNFPQVKDVSRVWCMRGALLLLDFEDSSADSIKELLLSSLIEPLYLTSVDGKKLLSFLFGLQPSFVESLHQTSGSHTHTHTHTHTNSLAFSVRNQIPWCPKAYLEIYGEIYFKSWRLASGPYLKVVVYQFNNNNTNVCLFVICRKLRSIVSRI